MPKDFSECRRGFHHFSAAWYGKARWPGTDEIDRITIGMFPPEGGTLGEFNITWIELSGRSVPQLRVFDDAWQALPLFADVLADLAKHDNERIAPARVCEILIACGVADLTARVQR